MVGVLIEMRAAVTRRQTTGKRALGTLLLAAFVTLLAAATLAAGLKHYHYAGAGANVVATLCFGWLLGWVSGPLITGDAALRMDYFKLLPVPARKLGYAMLGAAFADVSLAFSLVAFGALVALGAQSGVAAALTGAAAMLLDLVLAVVAGQVAIAVFGPVISSRRGRDFAAMMLALVITLLSLASSLVPLVAARLTDGHSPALSAVVRILPSGWGAVAVDAASGSDWGVAALCLAGLAALIAVLVLAWPLLLARRLMMSTGGARRHTSARGHAPTAKGILPATPFGAVLGRELRLYSRSTLRSMLLMISFLVAVVISIIGAISGQAWAWPWVLAGEPAMVIGCAGLLVLIGAWSVNAPAPDGGPSPMRVLKTHAALIAVPVVVLFPAAALLIPGAIGHSLLLRWLAVPAAIAWAAFLSWRSVQAAVRRLEERGPEVFAGTRAPAA
jgi:ABC-2 type transport system permease protein